MGKVKRRLFRACGLGGGALGAGAGRGLGPANGLFRPRDAFSGEDRIKLVGWRSQKNAGLGISPFSRNLGRGSGKVLYDSGAFFGFADRRAVFRDPGCCGNREVWNTCNIWKMLLDAGAQCYLCDGYMRPHNCWHPGLWQEDFVSFQHTRPDR